MASTALNSVIDVPAAISVCTRRYAPCALALVIAFKMLIERGKDDLLQPVNVGLVAVGRFVATVKVDSRYRHNGKL